jgi:hypothetical protein
MFMASLLTVEDGIVAHTHIYSEVSVMSCYDIARYNIAFELAYRTILLFAEYFASIAPPPADLRISTLRGFPFRWVLPY